MRKPKKLIEVSLHGAVGSGNSLTEARADAVGRIIQAFSHTQFEEIHTAYQPVTLRFPHGHIGIIYRDLEGYAYGIHMATFPTEIQHIAPTHYASKYDAEIALKRNIAQLYVFDEETHEGLDVLAHDDTSGKRDHERWLQFQHAYKDYATQGYTHNECYHLACATTP